MTLKLSVDTKELKGALAATEAVFKKTPNDVTPGDSKVALMCKEGGEWSLVSIHDYFSTEIRLPSVSVIAQDDDVVAPWDGGELSYSNFVGLPAPSEAQALLGKLKAREVELEVKKGSKKVQVSSGSENRYAVERADPRKISASYKKIQADMPVMTMTSEQFAWFCGTVTSLGKMVQPSASAPGYGNVVMSAFPSIGKPLVLSANSDASGYSIIHETVMTSATDFAALLPKMLSEALGTFIKQMGMPDGDVEMRCSLDSEKKATEIVFSSDAFSISLACMSNANFPFPVVYKLIDGARKPYCSYIVKKASLKDTMARMSIFTKDDDSTTSVKLLDGGSIEFVQHKRMLSREVNARELVTDGTVMEFPSDLSDVSTVVKTKVMKGALDSLPDGKEVTFSIGKPQKGSMGRLQMLGNDDMSSVTIILLGVRGAVR